jgi:hypothetical protein
MKSENIIVYGYSKDAEGHRRGSFKARAISEFVVGTEENYYNWETGVSRPRFRPRIF